jgi:hypothetical protein
MHFGTERWGFTIGSNGNLRAALVVEDVGVD